MSIEADKEATWIFEMESVIPLVWVQDPYMGSCVNSLLCLLISGQRGDLDFTSILYLCILFYSIECVYRVIHIDTGIVPV